LFIVAAIGGSVYGGEFKDFVCDTNQPGCGNVCFNRFSPINHIRFWSFQLLFVCCPVIFFHFFTMYQSALVDKAKRLRDEIESTEKKMQDESINDIKYQKLEAGRLLLVNKTASMKSRIGRNYGEEGFKEKSKRTLDKPVTVIFTRKIKLAYIVQIICRLFLEVVFFLLTAYLQSFKNMSGYNFGQFDRLLKPTSTFYEPERYNCTHAAIGNYMGRGYSACAQNTQITCWNNRPWEKQIFMYYMVVMNVICILFTVSELFEVICLESIKQTRKRQEQQLLMHHVPLIQPPAPASSDDLIVVASDHKEVDEKPTPEKELPADKPAN